MSDELNDLRKEIDELRAELSAMAPSGASFSANGGKPISLKDVNTELEYLKIKVSKLEDAVSAMRVAPKS